MGWRINLQDKFLDIFLPRCLSLSSSSFSLPCPPPLSFLLSFFLSLSFSLPSKERFYQRRRERKREVLSPSLEHFVVLVIVQLILFTSCPFSFFFTLSPSLSRSFFHSLPPLSFSFFSHFLFSPMILSPLLCFPNSTGHRLAFSFPSSFSLFYLSLLFLFSLSFFLSFSLILTFFSH